MEVYSRRLLALIKVLNHKALRHWIITSILTVLAFTGTFKVEFNNNIAYSPE